MNAAFRQSPEAPPESRWEDDNPSTTLADAQQHRLLELLRKAASQPIGFADLHASGISFPAAVVSELELNGYPTERVYDHGRLVGVRLLDSEPRDKPAARPRRRRGWPHR